MCFGVRDALEAARRTPTPERVAIHGELVHNPDVLRELAARGYEVRTENDRRRLSVRPAVMVTAHGISDRERARLRQAGKSLVDTTCPLVRRVHEAAHRLQGDGCLVVVVGRRDHVEVRGIVEDLDRFEVVERSSEVRMYPETDIGIICQTTTPESVAREVVGAVRRLNPRACVRFVDTVCEPTKQRRAALEDLLDATEAVVVVGGLNSNNTRRLVDRCRECDRPVLHVEGRPTSTRPGWLLSNVSD